MNYDSMGEETRKATNISLFSMRSGKNVQQREALFRKVWEIKGTC